MSFQISADSKIAVIIIIVVAEVILGFLSGAPAGPGPRCHRRLGSEVTVAVVAVRSFLLRL